MSALGWILLACMWGVLFYGCTHWYRQLLDTREGKYGWVRKNGVLR